MLAQRLRRWPNIKPTLVQRLVPAGWLRYSWWFQIEKTHWFPWFVWKYFSVLMVNWVLWLSWRLLSAGRCGGGRPGGLSHQFSVESRIQEAFLPALSLHPSSLPALSPHPASLSIFPACLCTSAAIMTSCPPPPLLPAMARPATSLKTRCFWRFLCVPVSSPPLLYTCSPC